MSEKRGQDMITTVTAENFAEVGEGMPLDMRKEVREALASGRESIVLSRRTWEYNVPPTYFVFFPNAGRGGVMNGADTDWTDCDGLDDLEERWVNYEELWSN